MTRIEDDLRTGLYERTAAATGPTRDLVAAAAARHHCRRAIQGAALTTGALGLAAVLAFSVTGNGLGSGAGADRATAAAPTVLLDARTVAVQVANALEASENQIRYVDIHSTFDGEASRIQAWRDDSTQAYRQFGAKIATAPFTDFSRAVEGDQLVSTNVDYASKTWQRTFSPAPEPVDASSRGDRTEFSPEAIRSSMAGEEPAFTVVGKEQIEGRSTLHLRTSGELSKRMGGFDDLWVDAETYELVRREITRNDEGHTTKVREDYRTLERTAANEAKLQAEVPAGFTQRPDRVPVDDPDAPARG